MPFDHFDVWVDASYPLKHKLGVAPPFRKCVCPSCMKKMVDRVAAQPNFMELQNKGPHNVSDHCDCCEENKTAFKWIELSDDLLDNLKFCTCGSWNGHFVCLDCVRIALEFGHVDGHVSQFQSGKYYSVNGKGLPVINGKVGFPK
jgi:hypothetical protein